MAAIPKTSRRGQIDPGLQKPPGIDLVSKGHIFRISALLWCNIFRFLALLWYITPPSAAGGDGQEGGVVLVVGHGQPLRPGVSADAGGVHRAHAGAYGQAAPEQKHARARRPPHLKRKKKEKNWNGTERGRACSFGLVWGLVFGCEVGGWVSLREWAPRQKK